MLTDLAINTGELREQKNSADDRYVFKSVSLFFKRQRRLKAEITRRFASLMNLQFLVFVSIVNASAGQISLTT